MLPYQRILLAVDLSGETAYIARRARTVAAAFGAVLEIVHVVELLPLTDPLPLPDSPAADPVVIAQTQQQLIDAASETLAQLAAELGIPAARRHVELGHTKTEILRLARELGVDLIVLGRRERHGLSLLVDLTEDTVLHKAACDVLAVRVGTEQD